jgi:hypothetical protein
MHKMGGKWAGICFFRFDLAYLQMDMAGFAWLPHPMNAKRHLWG